MSVNYSYVSKDFFWCKTLFYEYTYFIPAQSINMEIMNPQKASKAKNEKKGCLFA